MTQSSTSAERAALARLWPLIEKAMKGYVFTAAKAGEVAADMQALRDAALSPSPASTEVPQMVAPQDGMQFWLWKNGDHYLAFTHLYPCFTPGGDPMTLGEPFGRAVFRRSFDRAESGVGVAPSPAEVPAEPVALEQRPLAWFRAVCTPDTPMGPPEYDEECVPGEDRPAGDGWIPLYAAPQAVPPSAEPAAWPSPCPVCHAQPPCQHSHPIGHLHSNGEFCVERMPTAPAEWPVQLYAAPPSAQAVPEVPQAEQEARSDEQWNTNLKEVCALVNRWPALQSMLYDLNLLPEQTMHDRKRWQYTVSAAMHFEALAAAQSQEERAPVAHAPVPDGWQLVPKEPTEKMIKAADRSWAEGGGSDTNAYYAMLAAAPMPATPKASDSKEQA